MVSIPVKNYIVSLSSKIRVRYKSMIYMHIMTALLISEEVKMPERFNWCRNRCPVFPGDTYKEHNFVAFKEFQNQSVNIRQFPKALELVASGTSRAVKITKWHMETPPPVNYCMAPYCNISLSGFHSCIYNQRYRSPYCLPNSVVPAQKLNQLT